MLALINLADVKRRALRGCDLTVGERARVGIFGEAGSGLSTLLRVLSGSERPDSGSVERRPDIEISCLAPELEHDEWSPLEVSRFWRPDLQSLEDELGECARTVGESEYAESAEVDQVEQVHRVLERQADLLRRFRELGGPEFEGESRRWLRELGFTRAEMSRPLREFNEGRKRLASLAALLARCPDVLVLDEPEVRLPPESRELLEGALRLFEGALVVASRDPVFLDQTTEYVFELRNGRLAPYGEKSSARNTDRATTNVIPLSNWFRS